ncbi:MAG: hypothetical protein AAGF81_20415 [Pseudomonadota bacterium]
MLYRFQTNFSLPKFNIFLRWRYGDGVKSVWLEHYESLAVPDPSDPGCPGMSAYLLRQALDPERFMAEAELATGSRSRKGPDPSKFPALWTTDPLPVVTQEFRDFVEEVDPGLHQFFEFKLFFHKSDRRIQHTRFYVFICGRLLDIEPDEEVPDRNSYSSVFLRISEAPKVRTIQKRPDIQSFVTDLPIWSFREGGRASYFMSAEFLQAAQSKNLAGFTNHNARTKGNVGYVKYDH